MRLTTLVVCVLGCASLATAQTKFTGIAKCGAPDSQQAVDAGDAPDHKLMLIKQSCTWTSQYEIAGLKSATATLALFSDAAGSRSHDRGYVVNTMDNGDKAIVRFSGTATLKAGSPPATQGAWTFAGGTGKLKGLKGSGTYKGVPIAEGIEDHIEGTYSLPK
jgi:hypothetical protein